MFCINCGSKVDDDAIFCTSCGGKINKDKNTNTTSYEGLNNESFTKQAPQFKSPVSKDDIKQSTFLSLSMFKNQLSAISILENGMSYAKNLKFLLLSMFLLPLTTVLLGILGIALNGRRGSYFLKYLEFSDVFKPVLALALFLAAIIFITGGAMMLFTKNSITFENVVRASTLPMINLFIFTIFNLILTMFSVQLAMIASFIGLSAFLLSLFNGFRHYAPKCELLPITFSLSLIISTYITGRIVSLIIADMLFRF